MLNIELTQYGVDDTLKLVTDNLKAALGRNISKKQKDNTIQRAIGSLETLYCLVLVTDTETTVQEEAEA